MLEEKVFMIISFVSCKPSCPAVDSVNSEAAVLMFSI